MGKFWTLWKKGFIFSLIMAVIGFLLSTVVALVSLQDLITGGVSIGLGAIAILIVVSPIIQGYFIEWINNKIK